MEGAAGRAAGPTVSGVSSVVGAGMVTEGGQRRTGPLEGWSGVVDGSEQLEGMEESVVGWNRAAFGWG
ncbi:hypothetical protein CYMTET_13668 [Cymbomonas tetramitiformis]|uniref:Uncharacterized protein n=1 Tax=Cymbomonas tetramitiformis TaxID=36881 RepID=A0AAE0LB66_9CHLO|nr:hypothetical protein CYMTET_13668 [Cymbomonas tetramitiformis]